MTHRTFHIGGCLVNVFDSQSGADRFAKDAKGDVTTLVRGRSFHMKRGDVEITLNLKAEVDQKNGHLINAAKTIAEEIETMIVKEKLKAA